jgi:hypothetical protein
MELEPFVYLKTYRVLVCLKCRSGCVSDEVPTHLRSKHKDMAPATRRQVAETVNEIPGIIKNQIQLAAEFQFPPPTTPPIPELAPPQPDGRGCRKCPFVIRQDQKIQEHCGTCQNWINPQGRGRPKSEDTLSQLQKPWREGVLCQRFFLPSIQVGNAPHSRFCTNHLSPTILVYYHHGNGARSQNPAHFPKLSGIIWEWGPFSLVTLIQPIIILFKSRVGIGAITAVR